MSRNPLSRAAALCTAVFVLAGCAAPGSATSEDAAPQGTTTLRVALNQSEDHPSFVALQHFGERLSAHTEGRWKLDVFPNENLGAQQESLQLTSYGTVDMAIVSGTQLESLDKDFVVFNLPHVFDSVEHQMKVINDKAIVGELYSSLENENLTVLGGFTQGTRSIYSNRPLTRPADLDGMKIRVQESPVQSHMIERMGGAATPMSYGEVYTALQSGVLDGAENNEVSYMTQKHYEVAKYVSRTDHLVGLDYMVANTQRLSRMSPEDRSTFDQEWDATMREFTGLWRQATNEAISEADSRGVVFHEVDDTAFRRALAPLTAESLTSDSARRLYAATRAAAS